MTSTELLTVASWALNRMQPISYLAGTPDLPEPFSGRFGPRELIDAIDHHLEQNRGFTVILQYPGAGEGSYTSSSRADTWEAAVMEVAQEMLDNEAGVSIDDTLEIIDVFEGSLSHATARGVDRNLVVSFVGGHPHLGDGHA